MIEQAFVAGHSVVPISAVKALADEDDLLAVLLTGLEVMLSYGLVGYLFRKLAFHFLWLTLTAKHVLV